MVTTTEITSICCQAQQALADCSFYDLRSLHVDQDRGQLLITGRVGTYFLKQQAQEVVRSVASGLQLVNTVEVR